MHTTRHGRRGPRPDRHSHRHPPFGGPEFDEPGFGPGTSAAMRSGVDGLGFFTSAIAAVVGAAA